ncbi:MAG TPA: hypothetical protein PKA37_16620, partial [Planctomycetota bacterium]|nr:hypothetical protein [Planctomycetota bacterium]
MEVSGRNRGLSFSFLVMGPLLLLAACASDPVEPPKKDFGRPLPEGAPALVKVSLDEWPDLRPVFSDRKGALIALEESLQYFQKPSSREWFPYATADRSITHEEQVETLTRLKDALQRAQNP